jgi:hypothetical protein
MFPIKNFLFLCLLAASLTGCAKPPASAPKTPVTLTQAQEQFLKICKDELKYNVFVVPDGRSMWVYVPLKDGIVEFKPTSKNQAPKAPTDESWSITFLKTVFDHETKTFSVSYDIAMTKKYDQDVSYQNKFSEEYSTKQREVLTALTRAYFDVGSRTMKTSLTVGNDQVTVTPGNEAVDHVKNNPMTPIKDELPPEFFVMIFADTKHGIGIKAINYFQDMKMALSNPPSISNEEYIKRYVYELFGEEEMIGDTTGARMKTEEIVLGDFLAKQIENRIKYQFVQSGFPPSGEVRDEIWAIVAETFRLYEFKGVEKIKLIDLKSGQEASYDKSQL